MFYSDSHNVPIRDRLSRQADVVRGPLQVAFDITNRCNLRCAHCFNRSGREWERGELTDDEVMDLASQIVDMKPRGLCVCGGEPLLKESALYRFIKKVSSGGTTVNMVSNGLKMTDTVAKKLGDAGIEKVQISVDGATAESHERLRGVRGSFNRAVNALKILAKHEIQRATCFSATRYSIHEFPRFVKLMESINCPEIRVQPLMMLGQGILSAREFVPSWSQYRKLVVFMREYVHQTGANIQWGDPMDHFIRYRNYIREPNLFVHIGSRGDLIVSPYLPLFVGNIRHHSLSEYWEAGLNRLWAFPLIQKAVEKITSVDSMSRVKPVIFFEQPICVDLVDDPSIGMSTENVPYI